MEFVETSVFQKRVDALLSDDEHWLLQQALVANPELGSVMRGSGGIRKLRWVQQSRRKGKRGGIRVIYYMLTASDQFLMLYAYSKDKQEDLTKDQIKILRNVVEEELQ